MTTKKHYTTKDLDCDFGPLTFGRTLAAYRQAEELSAKVFARMLGITAQSLCDLERGRKIPSVERAAKIAKMLREPVESWVSLALEDQVRRANLKFRVDLKKVS
jgi:transcriptional regulator with XRE-family HTH domain